MQTIHGINQILLDGSILKDVPNLYDQEGKGEETVAYVKFFAPNSCFTWYMTEYNPETKEAFGWVEGFANEFGYFSIEEFVEINDEWIKSPNVRKPFIERDECFMPTQLKNIESYKNAFEDEEESSTESNEEK